MTTAAAAIAIVAALMAGYYFAQWRRSEGSLKSARALAQGAGKSVGKARRNLLLTGLAIAALIYLWIHGKGGLAGSRSVVPAGGPGGRWARWCGRECAIESGELEPGQPVPSITTLTQQWGVARETAAHALTTLEAEGLVRRYPGRGYYVTARG